ncbi:SLC5 family protein [Arenicella xantha]|uniref:SSS family solute:Na+ symporter n=1 Tax=Arenicella xantha TaxID=644221 RepID=A0A395JS62_9GAMM|nr:SLC5 family protein [Arenicella xantha]RBP51530.1 SSS family solute:Na+ symporter [Arenicella xantha]
MPLQTVQVAVFILVTSMIAFITYLKCRRVDGPATHTTQSDNKEVFLAGGGLTWVFVAGSITLTNLSTDQLVGMNGNQMALLAWWEFSAVVGLIILSRVFLPIYYKYECTTTTELLEKRYNNHHIRAVIGMLFMLGNVLIFMPTVLYTGSLAMQGMFGLDESLRTLMIISAAFAVIGAAYAALGGLRAVAVSDTYSGVLLLGLGMLVVVLSLKAIDFDFSGIPTERLTLIGGNDSPIPWHTLLTGMIFIQIYYWSTNQTITQRAMASPTLAEGQKGVQVAAVIRLLIVPAMIVLPGIVSYKLYGDIGDSAYGRIVGDVLPLWMSGMFAAALAAAVLTSFNSIVNSSAALYVCDFHEKYISSTPNVKRLNAIATVVFLLIALALVPMYAGADSIINLIQQMYGLLSMPIVACFIVGLMFQNVDYRAAIFAVVLGVLLYGYLSFGQQLFGLAKPPIDLHYIHLMFITLWSCVGGALLFNRLVLGRKATFSWAASAAA